MPSTDRVYPMHHKLLESAKEFPDGGPEILQRR